MEEASPIKLLPADLGRWLIIASIALIVLIPLYKGKKRTRPVTVKAAVFEDVSISVSGRTAEVARFLHEPAPPLRKVPVEAKGDHIPSPLPEERPVQARKIAASSFHFNKKELLFQPIILQAANRHQVDPALVMAIIMAESEFNPRAVSKKGAKGLMQLMPKTAKALGVKSIFNPVENITAGVRHFKSLLIRFRGDVRLPVAAYNAGSGRIKKYRGIPPFNATKAYVKKVFKYHLHYKRLLPSNGIDEVTS